MVEKVTDLLLAERNPFDTLDIYPVKKAKIREARESEIAAEHTERELELLRQQQSAESSQVGDEFVTNSKWKNM